MADADQLQLLAAERAFGGDTAYTPPAVVEVDARHRVELAAATARGDDQIRLIHRSQRP